MEEPLLAKKRIGICTSARRSNIEAFITLVASLTNVTVQFIQLPYNDLDNFRLSWEGLDGVIICHSINNRRFSITDVTDALYDVFLPHVRKDFGKDSVCVIAHDFPWPMGKSDSKSKDHARIKGTQMGTFRSKQPLTFECSKLAMICGKLDNQVDMDEEDWVQLEAFVHQCRVPHWIIFKRLACKAASEISTAITWVYESEINSPHRSRIILRYILMFLCLPALFMVKVIRYISSLTWLIDKLLLMVVKCFSFLMWLKENVIDKAIERYQSYWSRSGICRRVICCIPYCFDCCCYYIFTLISEVCQCIGLRPRDTQLPYEEEVPV